MTQLPTLWFNLTKSTFHITVLDSNKKGLEAGIMSLRLKGSILDVSLQSKTSGQETWEVTFRAPVTRNVRALERELRQLPGFFPTFRVVYQIDAREALLSQVATMKSALQTRR